MADEPEDNTDYTDFYEKQEQALAEEKKAAKRIFHKYGNCVGFGDFDEHGPFRCPNAPIPGEGLCKTCLQYNRDVTEGLENPPLSEH